MMRNLFQPGRRLLLAAVLALTALALLLSPAFAQGRPAPLVPNVEPAAQLAAGPPSEREAVAAALAALPSPALPPAGAILELPAAGPALAEASPAESFAVYLPAILRPSELGSGPDQATPTPVTPTPVTPTPVTPTPEPSEPANVTATLWAKPSIWVARGSILEYELRLSNAGRGRAEQTRVVFPYDRSRFTLQYTSLSSKQGDWVSAIDSDSFTITFGPLGGGERRSGKIFLAVKGGLAQGSLIDMRASYSWDGGFDGARRGTNWAPVLVGSGPVDAPYIWATATPDRGPAGTTHRFFTNRFLPGEAITTWLNTPAGVRALDLRGTADGQGSLTLSYSSAGLAKGSYQIVLYGGRSGLTGVASFIVQ